MVCMCSLMSKSPASNQVKNPPLILIAFCLRLVVLPGFKILYFFSHTQLTQLSTYSHHILSKTGGVAWLQNTVFFFPTLSLHNTEKQMHDCLIEALIVDLMCWAAQSWCPQSALTIPALWSASGNMATWQGNLSRSMFRLPKQQEIMLEEVQITKILQQFRVSHYIPGVSFASKLSNLLKHVWEFLIFCRSFFAKLRVGV
jgi:hypothetical protein